MTAWTVAEWMAILLVFALGVGRMRAVFKRKPFKSVPNSRAFLWAGSLMVAALVAAIHRW